MDNVTEIVPFIVTRLYICVWFYLSVGFEEENKLVRLDSSVGRALHRYRRGHGFESRLGLNFFQALISRLLKLSV